MEHKEKFIFNYHIQRIKRKYCTHKTKIEYYVKGVENKKELWEIIYDY